MDDRAKKLIEKMDGERGFSRPWRNMLAERDPDYMEIYHNMAVHVFNKRNALPLKFKEIICICMDALTSYEEGLRVHIRKALEAGATEDEILEALEVLTLLGVHNLSIHLPALVEEVNEYKERQAEQK
jgi:alkylhydroperoxidase/carboxymuconolactone decarboxylase family protein YurZ